VDNEKLTANPAARIKRRAEHNGKIRFLSEEEHRLKAALTESWPHYLSAFLVSIHTGMRASEQFGLRWIRYRSSAKQSPFTGPKVGRSGTSH